MRPPEQWAAERGIPADVVREIQRDAMLAIAINGCGDDPPPRSRVEFRLSVGAESRERLAKELEDLADRIRHSPNHHHPIESSGVWGGCGSHGQHELSEHEGVTREHYDAELHPAEPISADALRALDDYVTWPSDRAARWCAIEPMLAESRERFAATAADRLQAEWQRKREWREQFPKDWDERKGERGKRGRI